ncbi:hypothetical protein BACCAP_04266 [Pseudoflavonifractor capillosus ATCC 29799]|uniref:Uncharacterized protein n=1 Tax=Pseudoflavonifractor capillosus ATCC 29799 TaxID=411467 RepID=A6P199_9FIRM|nr:hypothetical protein [Pseudoflavonifractor capillosus]EDM97791.1 hypothetical protein BACCAP_04266 [Pseudoflavonifractor capillosus ATCC 29799]
MKLRKLLSLLLMVCVLGLLCTSCATTALDNITTYYAEVGAVMDDWFASSTSADGSATESQSTAAKLDTPADFTLSENGDYSFTGVANADYYLVYFCAPDATGDSDPFLFSSNSIAATGTGGETYSGNIDDLVQYGYGEYLVKVFAFPSLNDSAHAMSTAATASYSFSGAQDAPVVDYLWNTFDSTVDVQVSNIADYMYQAYPDSVEVTFTNTADSADTVVVTVEELSADHYNAVSDALTPGATYDITAVAHSENAYVTNPTSDTTQVAQGVTFDGHNVISANYYYTDGIARNSFSYPQYVDRFDLTNGGVFDCGNSSISFNFTAAPTTTSAGSAYTYSMTSDNRPFAIKDGTLELYTDGTFRFDQYSEMPPQGPSHIEGIWTDNGDGTANLSFDHSTLRTSLDPDY